MNNPVFSKGYFTNHINKFKKISILCLSIFLFSTEGKTRCTSDLQTKLVEMCRRISKTVSYNYCKGISCGCLYSIEDQLKIINQCLEEANLSMKTFEDNDRYQATDLMKRCENAVRLMNNFISDIKEFDSSFKAKSFDIPSYILNNAGNVDNPASYEKIIDELERNKTLDDELLKLVYLLEDISVYNRELNNLISKNPQEEKIDDSFYLSRVEKWFKNNYKYEYKYDEEQSHIFESNAKSSLASYNNGFKEYPQYINCSFVKNETQNSILYKYYTCKSLDFSCSEIKLNTKTVTVESSTCKLSREITTK